MTPSGQMTPAPTTMGRPVKLVWAGALCAALVFHAAGFAAAWSRLSAPETDNAAGAAAIEIGLELTAPHKEQDDLPPGPEADASAAATAAVEQKAKVEKTELPKAQPTETPDPDRAVAPDAAKTPQETNPNLQDAKADPTAESTASEAAAPPSLETAREAPRSAAPALGTGENAQRVRLSWQKELTAHLNRFKRYPGSGSHRELTVVVTFSLDRLGHVISANLQNGSGDAAFDQAALTMMARADPVPPPPPLVADDGLTFTLPVIFRDKKK